MNQYDAFKILGLSGQVNQEDIKQAYRKAAFKYHPDRNPAGLEMMKMVNAAYEAIKEFSGDAKISEKEAIYGEAIAEALNKIIVLSGLVIEICGAWVWVGGETKLHKEILKKAGFKWSPNKARWYFRPEGERSFKRSKSDVWNMDKIRDKFGSKHVQEEIRFIGE